MSTLRRVVGVSMWKAAALRGAGMCSLSLSVCRSDARERSTGITRLCDCALLIPTFPTYSTFPAAKDLNALNHNSDPLVNLEFS